MILQIITVSFFILAGLSLIMVLVEDNQVRLFSQRWYRIGFLIWRNAIVIPNMNAEQLSKEVYTKDEGVYFFGEDACIYFRSLSSQKMWKLRTPFAFKCTGTLLNAETIEITARLPLAATALFFSFFLIGLVLSLLLITAGFYFMAFPAFMFLLSYFVEKYRLGKMLTELRELLTSGH